MNTEEFQRLVKWGRVALIVLVVFLSAEALGSLKDLRKAEPSFNTISVSGEGEAMAVPDVASFSFSVSADEREVSAAQARVTASMNAILEELKALGIEERDIKTTDYSVYPRYVSSEPAICTPTFCPPSRGQVQDGFTARHGVSVKVRNTENAGRALTLVGERGATGLSGISFIIDNPDKVTEEARAEAIADAREKAKVLSRELGVRLVRVVSFHDNTGGGIPYYAERSFDMVATGSSAPAPNIPMGENKVMANVTIVYEIR